MQNGILCGGEGEDGLTALGGAAEITSAFGAGELQQLAALAAADDPREKRAAFGSAGMAPAGMAPLGGIKPLGGDDGGMDSRVFYRAGQPVPPHPAAIDGILQ